MHHACPYPVCRCGTEVDINRASPVLRDPNDIVLQNDSVDSMYSYHSGGYENWPDLAAYTADMTLAGRPRAGFDPQRMVKSKPSLAGFSTTAVSVACDCSQLDGSTLVGWRGQVRVVAV